jgi:hypothetical protein
MLMAIDLCLAIYETICVWQGKSIQRDVIGALTFTSSCPLTAKLLSLEVQSHWRCNLSQL